MLVNLQFDYGGGMALVGHVGQFDYGGGMCQPPWWTQVERQVCQGLPNVQGEWAAHPHWPFQDARILQPALFFAFTSIVLLSTSPRTLSTPDASAGSMDVDDAHGMQYAYDGSNASRATWADAGQPREENYRSETDEYKLLLVRALLMVDLITALVCNPMR